MGMDLYKYKATKTSDDELLFIGTKLTEKELSFFENFEIVIENDVDMDKVSEFAKEKFNTEIVELFYSFEGENTYLLKMNEKTYTDLNNLEKNMNEADEYEDYDKFSKIMETKIVSIERDISKYTEKGKDIEIKYGTLYLMKDVPMQEEFYIKCNRDEVGYMRKPFRHYSTPTKSENGTTTLYIDNTTGAKKEDLDTLYNKANYKKDTSIFVVTNKHDIENEFLTCVSEDNLEYAKSLFPLMDDEVIAIDW